MAVWHIIVICIIIKILFLLKVGNGLLATSLRKKEDFFTICTEPISRFDLAINSIPGSLWSLTACKPEDKGSSCYQRWRQAAGNRCFFNLISEPAHDKTYNKTCVTNNDIDQTVHPPSVEVVGGYRDQWTLDVRADLNLLLVALVLL